MFQGLSEIENKKQRTDPHGLSWTPLHLVCGLVECPESLTKPSRIAWASEESGLVLSRIQPRLLPQPQGRVSTERACHASPEETSRRKGPKNARVLLGNSKRGWGEPLPSPITRWASWGIAVLADSCGNTRKLGWIQPQDSALWGLEMASWVLLACNSNEPRLERPRV